MVGGILRIASTMFHVETGDQGRDQIFISRRFTPAWPGFVYGFA
jgi:hypothetical protein